MGRGLCLKEWFQTDEEVGARGRTLTMEERNLYLSSDMEQTRTSAAHRMSKPRGFRPTQLINHFMADPVSVDNRRTEAGKNFSRRRFAGADLTGYADVH